MGLKLLPRKRYRVEKISKLSGALLPTSAPEAARRFWTRDGAAKELTRLTRIADSSGLPYSYRVARLHGK